MHADMMYSSHDYAECLQAVNRSLQESDLTALHKQKLQMQGIVCLLGEKKATEAVLSLTSFLSLHITEYPTGELTPCPSILARRLEVMFVNGADIVLLGFVLLLNFYEVIASLFGFLPLLGCSLIFSFLFFFFCFPFFRCSPEAVGGQMTCS